MSTKVLASALLLLFFAAFAFRQVSTRSSLGPIEAYLFKTAGVVFSQSIELLSLKDVHLDANALLNKMVRIGGKIESIGNLETLIVISDGQARMLVQLTSLTGQTLPAGVLRAGREVEVIGKVQSGLDGRAYIVAEALHGL